MIAEPFDPDTDSGSADAILKALDDVYAGNPAAVAVPLNLTTVDATLPLDGSDMAAYLSAVIQDWLNVSHRVMDYKEIENLNDYIEDVQLQEGRRLGHTHDSMTNNMLVAKQMYLMQLRASRRLQSHVRMLMYTFLYVCAVFALAPHIGESALAKVGAVLATAAYGTALVLFVKINSTRRMDDWDKQYWRSGELDKGVTAVTSAAAAAAGTAGACSAAGGVPFSA